MNAAPLIDYLDHMYIGALDACSFTDGLEKSDFLDDKRTQQAVVMSLIIIGEAATKLMDNHHEFASKHAHIPWRNMRGMRNRIAHGYFDINLDVVWDTVKAALPELLAQLVELRRDLESKDGRDDDQGAP